MKRFDRVVLGVAGVVAGVLVGSPTLATVALPAVWFVDRLGRHRAARRVERDRQAALGELIDVMGQRVRSGSSLHGAVLAALADPAVESLGEELGPVASAVAGGRSLDRALYDLGDRTELAELSLLATSVGVLVEHGGPAGPAIERLGELVRSIDAARLDSVAQASQATASAVVMAALPAVFAVVVALVDGRMAAFYLRSPLGAVCVGAAASLSTIGWLWMERLIWGSS